MFSSFQGFRWKCKLIRCRDSKACISVRHPCLFLLCWVVLVGLSELLFRFFNASRHLKDSPRVLARSGPSCRYKSSRRMIGKTLIALNTRVRDYMVNHIHWRLVSDINIGKLVFTYAVCSTMWWDDCFCTRWVRCLWTCRHAHWLHFHRPVWLHATSSRKHSSAITQWKARNLIL